MSEQWRLAEDYLSPGNRRDQINKAGNGNWGKYLHLYWDKLINFVSLAYAP
jgi:hypothetical protein